MRLSPIPADELPAFIEGVEAQYAEQKTSMGGIPEAEAAEAAHREMAVQFPDGRAQAGHAILIAEADDGTRVGRVWLAPRGTEQGLVFVYDVQIDPDHRGRGYGRQLMRLAHEWAQAAGYSSISLHVFGGNTAAIGLYRSMGYEVTDLSMRRDL